MLIITWRMQTLFSLQRAKERMSQCGPNPKLNVFFFLLSDLQIIINDAKLHLCG